MIFRQDRPRKDLTVKSLEKDSLLSSWKPPPIKLAVGLTSVAAYLGSLTKILYRTQHIFRTEPQVVVVLIGPQQAKFSCVKVWSSTTFKKLRFGENRPISLIVNTDLDRRATYSVGLILCQRGPLLINTNIITDMYTFSRVWSIIILSAFLKNAIERIYFAQKVSVARTSRFS